ncbi:MAG: CoB--CoM heterodisulfide reductase subunit B [Promethearchaeota archaeon]
MLKIQSDRKNIPDPKDLERKIEKDPSDYKIYIELAQLYCDLGNRLEAYSWFSRAQKRFPDKSYPSVKLGDVLLKEGKYKDAYLAYQRALDINPDDPFAWMGVAKVYNLFKSPDEALEACARALNLSRDDPKVLKLAIFNCIKTDLLKSAKALADRALKILFKGKKILHPEDLNTAAGENLEDVEFIFFYIGLIYIRRKEYHKAQSYLEQISKDSPYYAEALNNLGLTYLNQGNLERSANLFKKLLFDESDNQKILMIRRDPKVWLNYGLLMETKGDYLKAYEAYQEANKLRKEQWPYILEFKKFYLPEKMTEDEQAVLDRKIKLLENQRAIMPNMIDLKYALYLGCVIPNRYPMIEAATRKFFKTLGIKIDDMEGASCCPAPGVFRSFDIPTWLTIGARNISIAERMNDDLVTLCNGCYGTLLEVNHSLKESKEKRDFVNKHLSGIGVQYQGTNKVKHIVEVMYYDIGLKELERRIKRKWNMNVAVHYGCHLLKPAEIRPWHGEFEEPSFFDELVELTGCKSLDYKDKMMCCGAGGGLRSAVKESSLDFTFTKLKNMRDVGAEAIITCCPFCHLQFDLGQIEVNNIFRDQIEEPFNIPVVYITQLYDYCFGIDPYSIGLLRPKVIKGTSPFVNTFPIFEGYYEII